MAFTSTIPDGFPNLYAADWRLELQQLSARLAPFIDVDIIHGEGKRYQRLPKVAARTIDGRFGDTNPDDISPEYRWLYVGFKDSAHRIDRREALQLGEVGSPHDAILRLQKAAAGRDMDKVLVDGIIGTVQSGKTGATPITLPAAQQIAVDFRFSGSGNTGMTFDKALQAATLFGVSQVYGQDVENQSQGCLVISAYELRDLLVEEKLTSADYGLRRLQDGQVVNLFGMAVKVVDPDLLPYASGTDIRTAVAFAREHVMFGMAENPQAFVDVMPDKRHDVQLRTEWGWGATRLADEGVVTILCDESP